METYVLFKGSKRISVREDDMSSSNISRIFQVSPDSMYLSDDRNTAIFPEETGNFAVHLLTDRAHYEVNGDPIGIGVAAGSQPPQQAPAYSPGTASGPSHRFSFASSSRGASSGGQPSWAATPPTFKRPQNKTFARNVQLVEAQGSTLLPIQTVYLRLTEQEANVSCITDKVQDQLDSQQPVIIVDSKGQEIQDSPGTQGPDFWKTPTRKVLCMTASAHREFLSGTSRKTKHRRRDLSDALEEQNDIMESILDKSKAIEDSLDVIKTATSNDTLVKFTRREERVMRDSFSCTICKEPLKNAVFSRCCKNLLACQPCLTQWYLNSSNCPKCRAETGEQDRILATGLDEALQVISNIIKSD